MATKALIQAVDLGKNLFHFSFIKCIATLLLMIFRACSNGVGLLLIIPLLHLIGIPLLGHGNSQITQWCSTILTYLHVPLSLLSILCLFFLVQAVVAIVNLLEEVLRSSLHEQYQHQMHKTLYQQLIHTKWTFLVAKNNSALLHHLTAQVQSVSVATFMVLQLVSQIILIMGYGFLSFMVSWKMTLVAGVVALLLLSILLPLHRSTAKSGSRFSQLNRSLFHNFYEQLNGLKVIKSSHTEERFIKQMVNQSQALQKYTHEFTVIRTVSKCFYSIGSALAFCILLYIAIMQIHLATERLILLLIVFARILPMISSLQQSYQQLLRHLPAYTDLKKLSQECLANQEHLELSNPEQINFAHQIELKNISFSYHRETLTPLISNLSLSIYKNQITVLTGRSGIGKSTLADLIIGLIEPNLGGSVYIDHQQLNQYNLAEWRKKIAYITQDPVLFNASVRDNLTLFSEQYEEQSLWDVLEQVAAASFVRRLPQALDTSIGDRGTFLSGGERQRLALARALLINPQLLILDESTNALDPETLNSIRNVLHQLHGKITLLIISHQEEFNDLADRVVNLTAGGIKISQNKTPICDML